MLINEISRKLGITARAIRFYEQKGLIKPAKQKDNGYRTYTEQDAWDYKPLSLYGKSE
ncbi:MerR family DNA-binding transcriptional regulator [Paenibacillus sp. V4I5]|uniref:MerR family DNA-binding transcriptional regulator n=1 Tax=Paenibacillus sp. V4I5 TaxID=3042306 RepID=UPI00278F0428|nr:MerR family DNA-binding transcriptional regulator [Paenibacillus sp. V4I5]MDQ0916811.1 DNA-binding transcriptional MerR regulator [Paenibacillus sp. V4I5]